MHEVNFVDAGTLVALIGIVIRDGWRWLRPNGTAAKIQLAVMAEQIAFIKEKVERIEERLDRK